MERKLIMPKSNEELIADVNAAVKAIDDKHSQIINELKEGAKGTKEDAANALATAEKLSQEIQGISANIVEIQQQLEGDVLANKESPKTLGQMVIATDAYKQYAAGNSQKFRIEANTIGGQEGSPPENSNTLVPAQRGAIVGGAFRMLRVADIIPQGTITSNMLEYTQELLFTNNAAETEEAATKPESVLTFELKQAPVRTIAHFIKATKQILEDAPALASYIDTRMRYGVELRKENQMISGDGTGQNISGMLDSGNYTAFTPTVGETALDSINRAIYAVSANDYAATGIILNPADWGAIERIKGTDDHYVIGNPSGILGPRLWGLPVVVSNAMTAGSFIVAAFDIAYQWWNRSGVVVEMFEQDSDNVQKNLITIRSEARGALASYRPASASSGLLVSTATA
jgi:HK97 family phage major capsid protein